MVLFAGAIDVDWVWIPIVVFAVVVPAAILVAGVSEILVRVRPRSGRSPGRSEAARPVPALSTGQAVSGTLNPPRLERHYLSGAGAATAYEQRSGGEVVAGDGTCALVQLGPNMFPCRERRSPGGKRVFFSAPKSAYPRRMAFAVVDSSLVRLTFEQMPEAEGGRHRVHAGLIPMAAWTSTSRPTTS